MKLLNGWAMNPVRRFEYTAGLILLSVLVMFSGCGDRNKKNVSTPPVSNPDPVYDLPENDSEVRLRGYQELSELIEANLMEPDLAFTIAKFVGGASYGYDTGLATLLGFYDGNPVSPGWRNTSANAMSSTVLMMAFDGLGRKMAQECVRDQSVPSFDHLKLSDETFKILKTICASGSSSSDAELRDFWMKLTGRLVPDQEFAAWLEGVREVAAEPWTVEDRIAYMVTTALSAPSFIFKS